MSNNPTEKNKRKILFVFGETLPMIFMFSFLIKSDGGRWKLIKKGRTILGIKLFIEENSFVLFHFYVLFSFLLFLSLGFQSNFLCWFC
jgi:hypothetical protein